ncbi:MAG: biotin--[acetyl-CoA-carboxylase] ligase [Rikenellaceae bacterium]
MKLIYRESALSTNDCVRELDEALTLVYVGEQRKGRGQRGNTWESEPHKNLTFSILLKPTFLPAEKQFELSMIVSLSIVATLERYGLHPLIKWPNDIYIGDKKICGILIENDICSSGLLSRSIVGIGLNVNQKYFLSDAPNPTSIFNEIGKENKIEDVLDVFSEEFTKLYDIFSTSQITNLEDIYSSLLYKRDVVSKYSDAKGAFKGTIRGIAEWGTLVIEKENSEVCKYQFKEVSYIL